MSVPPAVPVASAGPAAARTPATHDPLTALRIAVGAVGSRVGRRLRRLVRYYRARWLRSLRLRVVTTTVALSIIVVTLLGTFLVERIKDGLVEAKVESSLVEVGSGAREAQEGFDAGNSADDTARVNLARVVVGRLRAGGDGNGDAQPFQLLLLPGPSPDNAFLGFTFTSCLGSRRDECVVPDSLREQVRDLRDQAQKYTFTRMPVLDDVTRTVPALAVGAPVSIQGQPFELYYLFPLDAEQDTLNLVQRTLAVAGAALVLLVGLIVFVVIRQVVTPVRMAARISERLAAGRLEERMLVRGEDDLARLAASFNKMATNLQRQIRQLEDLSRVQRRFVSDVSHELRTPLTTVRMAADVLYEARPDFDAVTSRSAELLQTQLDRFESMLSDLLEISRFDAGAAVLETEPVDLRVLAARVIEATESLAEFKETTVTLHAPPTPCVAEVDSRRVDRILRNLLVNAIEHGEGHPVDVILAATDDAVSVAVRDHGVGLRPGETALVFNRFWRADPARARTTGGSGLGLSIALEDAHLHGGWLQAWGEPGDGAQFRLTVPTTAGAEIDRAPIPLEPADAQRRERGSPVGGPYRHLGSGSRR